jgi:hypothetical protein
MGNHLDTIKIRPYDHLFRQGILACVAFMTPVFVVLYFLSVPTGDWPGVVVAQALLMLAIALTALAYFRAAIWVSPTSISERGFFGRKVTVERSAIGSIVLVEVFERSSGETRPQLFVCDHDDRQVLRMRGQFWSRENMDIVVATLHVPVQRLEDGVSTSDIRLDNPGLLYWFERRPVLAVGLFTLAMTVLGIGVYFGVAAMGL